MPEGRVSGHDERRAARSERIQVGSPRLALRERRGIGGPDMHPSEEYPAEHSPQGRHPQAAAVGEALGIDDLDGMALWIARMQLKMFLLRPGAGPGDGRPGGVDGRKP